MHDTYEHQDRTPLSAISNMVPEEGLPQQMLDELTAMVGRQLAVYASACESRIAEQMGIPLIDLKALEFVMEFRALPTGQLTHLLGLSSGGTTALINRLEEAGYIRRDRHPLDRRIIVIKPNPGQCARIPAITEQVLAQIVTTAACQSPAQLASTHGFLRHCTQALRHAALEWLDADTSAAHSSVT